MTETARTLPVVQQVGPNPGPGAVLPPASEAAVDGLPGAIPLGEVAPQGARMETPQNPIEDALVVLPRATPTVPVGQVREERGEAFPLPLRKFMAIGHEQSPGRTATNRTGRSPLMYPQAICQTEPSPVTVTPSMSVHRSVRILRYPLGAHLLQTSPVC
jgi:hypothetical protein